MIETFVATLKEILSDNNISITEVYGGKAPVNATLPYVVFKRSYSNQYQTKDSNSAANTRLKVNVFYGSSSSGQSAFMRAFNTADIIRRDLNGYTVGTTEFRVVELESDYSEEIEQDFITLDIEVFHHKTEN